MFKTIVSLLFTHGVEWKFWGAIIKILVILFCIVTIAFLSWKRKNNRFCKSCKKRVRHYTKFCHHCGEEMKPENQEIIIGVNKKTKVISILSITILSLVVTFSVMQFINSFNFSNYGTGLYHGYYQTDTQKDAIWGVVCDKALTTGTFHQTINSSNANTLWVESKSDSGTLVLNIQQGDRMESIDITNTNTKIQYDLSKFSTDSDIYLSVEHSVAKNIQFKIYWE